jgi:hypothetical protein
MRLIFAKGQGSLGENAYTGSRSKLRLGSKRRGEENRTRASEEGATVYHSVFQETLCESGNDGMRDVGPSRRVDKLSPPSRLARL